MPLVVDLATARCGELIEFDGPQVRISYGGRGNLCRADPTLAIRFGDSMLTCCEAHKEDSLAWIDRKVVA